jgi:hypothetical protein
MERIAEASMAAIYVIPSAAKNPEKPNADTSIRRFFAALRMTSGGS